MVDLHWIKGKPQVPGVYWIRQNKGVVLCFVAECIPSGEFLVAARLIPGRSKYSVYNAPPLARFECIEHQEVGAAIGLMYQGMTMTWDSDG